MPLAGSSAADIDADAARLQCDYILLAELNEVKTSKPGKIGGMLKAASGGGPSKDVQNVKATYRLYAAGATASPRASGDVKVTSGGFGVGSALKMAAFVGQMYSGIGMMRMMRGSGLGMAGLDPISAILSSTGLGSKGFGYSDPRSMAMNAAFSSIASGLGGGGLDVGWRRGIGRRRPSDRFRVVRAHRQGGGNDRQARSEQPVAVSTAEGVTYEPDRTLTRIPREGACAAVHRWHWLWESFFALGSQGSAFDTKWHADATRAAMDQNGFSADARLLCQFENYITDYYSGIDSKPRRTRTRVVPGVAAAARHRFVGAVRGFISTRSRATRRSNTSGRRCESNTSSALLKWAKAPAVKPGYRPVVLMTVLCGSLHAVQDFYSHSNWLKRVASGGVPRTTPANNASAMGTPIWFDVPESRSRADQRTHRLVSRRQQAWRAVPPGREQGHHGTAAQCRRVRRRESEPPLTGCDESSTPRRTCHGRELKAWRALPANLNGTWLKNADATFITTTSTIAGHWDGGDAGQERVLARSPRATGTWRFRRSA